MIFVHTLISISSTCIHSFSINIPHQDRPMHLIPAPEGHVCPDTMISSIQTSHDTAITPESHLNSSMRSNQSRRQSNQTGPPWRLPCPLYAWWHPPEEMEKGDFNFAEVTGQEKGITGVIRECKMSWWKHREYECVAKKKCYIMKIEAIQFGFSLDGLEENVHLIIH